MLWWKRGVLLAAIWAALLTACSAEDPDSVAGEQYAVVITEFDPEWKIRAIKAIRQETGLGLADAKRLIESTPAILRTGLTRIEADALAARLRNQGMTAELRRE